MRDIILGQIGSRTARAPAKAGPGAKLKVPVFRGMRSDVFRTQQRTKRKLATNQEYFRARGPERRAS